MKNLKKFFLIILFSAVFMSGASKESLCSGRSIGGFCPGMEASSLSRLGMPFPVDTGGWHSFLNKNEGVVIRFLIRKTGNRWVVQSVNLLESGYPESLNEHLMLTGVSLKSFSTDRGASLGGSMKKVRQACGGPDEKTCSGPREKWFYYNCKSKKGALVFEFKEGRVSSVMLD